MRPTLAIQGAILLFLGGAGFWTDQWLNGLIRFEPVENLFRVFLGAALCATALRGRKEMVRTWTTMTGLFFGLWSLLGLVQPVFVGIHFESAENFLHLGLGGLSIWSSLTGEKPPRNPERTRGQVVTPPGPPEHESGEEYEPLPAPGEAVGSPVEVDVRVTDEMLLNAARETANWLTYYHDYAGQMYVPDPEINPANVGKLVPKWIFQTGLLGGFETTPLVVNGIMYLTTGNGPHVIALDAATGLPIWEYAYPRPKGLAICCGAVNRGVALGGDKLYFTTLDAHLVALDARSGRLLWNVTVGNPRVGESLTEAPLYYKGKVLVGLSGGEYNVKGRMHCVDAETGRLRWVFHTVANFGWGNGDPKLYGGACPWMTGVIDPETDTLFVGTSNPSPDYNGSVRPGNNPYSCSILALDMNTGKLRWYYQVSPHDLWDYDAANPIFLFTARVGGKPVKAVGHADKTGYFYVLDRATGKLLLRSEEFVPHLNFGAPPTPEGVVVCPGQAGGAEWPPAAYRADFGLVYIAAVASCAKISSSTWEFVPGRLYWGSTYAPQIGEAFGTLTAMETDTGKIRWQYRANLPLIGGAMTTGTGGEGLVFTGEQDGFFEAFDALSGKLLWRFQCGAGIHAPAISYRAGGRQYIAVAAGDGGWLEGFGIQQIGNKRVVGGRLGDAVIAFGLPD
ncbi:MAG TPA: PQQ-binding-like beta-propeller repeat protein [Symbiobacteriaceae bacterium]|jgi:PQQ-dependent dehydrogenase (methanol/ethanol family)